MAYDIIKKNVYYDAPNEYPHSSRNHFEDFQDYHDPLGRQHHATIHDRGIAAGLEVSGAPGDNHVSINPGTCVDGQGQLIVLSTAGQGDIGDDPPVGNSNPVPVPVQLPLAAQAGKKVYITIQYSTINQVNEGSGGRLEQIPWIRLQPTAGGGAYVDDGSSVILGIVNISGGGTITTLSATDGALPYGRRSLGEPVSELRVRRSQAAANQLSETLSGRVSAGASGGLQVTVPNSSDTVLFSRDGGTHCASVETRADTSVWKDSAGRDVVHIDTNNAWLRIGANGNEGDLIVQTQNGGTGLAFDGSACRLDIGGVGTAGHIFMRNAAAGITAHVDGGNSSVNANNLNPYGQDLIDVGARFLHVHGWDFCLDGRSGGNKRALVDANQKLVINWANDYANGVEVNSNFQVDKTLMDGAGVPLMGNPARKVAMRWLFATAGTQSMDIDLGSSRQFTAFCPIVTINSTTDFDYDNAVFGDIAAIDGTPTGVSVSGPGSNYGGPGDPRNMRAFSVTGVGRVITVRVWAIGPDIQAGALGIVFFE
jgi:hypothetical protein